MGESVSRWKGKERRRGRSKRLISSRRDFEGACRDTRPDRAAQATPALTPPLFSLLADTGTGYPVLPADMQRPLVPTLPTCYPAMETRLKCSRCKTTDSVTAPWRHPYLSTYMLT